MESGYAFGYRVRDYNTGNDFGHTQKRMTDGTTMGEYKILMPDGRTQNVKYKADDNGYQADVSYDVWKLPRNPHLTQCNAPIQNQ